MKTRRAVRNGPVVKAEGCEWKNREAKGPATSVA